WIRGKFKAPYDEANLRALQAGYNYANTMELFQASYEVPAATLEPGTYRNITGNAAVALGLVAGSKLAGRPLFQGAYPITPASDVLHNLATFKDMGVVTFQAEDEIAAVSASIGAAWGGSIAVTSSSGPGIALKGEALGLALIAELPLIVINIQRGGPSTGLPTKTEQSDLLMSMYGRHGESPLPVLAASTPSDCFECAIEAVRIATRYVMPVMLLTDGYLANGSEPWRLPDLDTLEPFPVEFAQAGEDFQPYRRDPETLARNWAIPGVEGTEHRIGGLEKQETTGNVSYDPENHEYMCKMRAEKVARIGKDIPPVQVHGDTSGLLVLSWGGTFGAARSATNAARRSGERVGHVHLRWLNPFPPNLGEVLGQYDRVLVPELNLGQLNKLLIITYGIEVVSHTKIQGQPFKVSELLARIQTLTS
ncbi:MAG: 2-oxoacid:acceptor oxidoreductase subunit alpha, partial [Myxococcota bacterium]|nr:2-oxoacid:acceptor oxidoreductase subunit alpha [Myxococcota bacterium]